MSRTWTLEQLTGFLRRAGVCLECGSRDQVVEDKCVRCIIAEDVRVNWPPIQAEMDEREARENFIPVQDGVREEL